MILIVEPDAHCPAGFYGALLNAWAVPQETWRPYVDARVPSPAAARGVIVLGGAMGVHDEAQYPFLPLVKQMLWDVIRRDIPCLGICLGGQLLAQVLGAKVHSQRHGEHGCASVQLTAAGRRDPLFGGLPSPFSTFHWHNDSFEIPQGATHLAFTPTCAGQAFRRSNAWGVQFHPEVDAAIVDDWRQRIHADPAVVNAFCSRQARLQAVGEQLLRNFVQITDSLPPIA